jgi:hypothetical protein
MTLVTAADFELHTGLPAPDYLAAVEAVALRMASSVLRRPLVSVVQTLAVPVAFDGWAYVAGPVTDCALPFEPHRIYVGATSGTVTLTFTAGYTPETCPEPLRRAICLAVASLITPPSGAVELPAGVQSVSVGDVSVTRAAGFAPAGGGSVASGMEPLAALGAEACALLASFRARPRP